MQQRENLKILVLQKTKNDFTNNFMGIKKLRELFRIKNVVIN